MDPDKSCAPRSPPGWAGRRGKRNAGRRSRAADLIGRQGVLKVISECVAMHGMGLVQVRFAAWRVPSLFSNTEIVPKNKIVS